MIRNPLGRLFWLHNCTKYSRLLWWNRIRRTSRPRPRLPIFATSLRLTPHLYQLSFQVVIQAIIPSLKRVLRQCLILKLCIFDIFRGRRRWPVWLRSQVFDLNMTILLRRRPTSLTVTSLLVLQVNRQVLDSMVVLISVYWITVEVQSILAHFRFKCIN